MNVTAPVDIDTLGETLDFLHCLKGEWNWKEHEPRAGNQREYFELLATISRISEACDIAEKGLPPAEVIQKIYAGTVDANTCGCCSHPMNVHPDNGACLWAGCNCELFRPITPSLQPC